ncbi:MAG: tRNA (adenosine(37)-N6)-threonylcarbamoyltransferase complex dimerization subunit type 1 TsaB [Phycisphaerales bacterium]|nr:tRNA (adenosine(37)-N6)-threonylcarbamoyltransferase complex dimerization subunit type 1 TsaB [Phycisphaerales bacterium]
MFGILAIESSQRSVSVAIRGRDGVLHERTATGDPREHDLLLPAIVALCEDAQLTQRDLRAVAVSTGPGGFTGLRVSIATAKGLCEALGIPAIAVPSALVAAMGRRSEWLGGSGQVAVALAGKGEACWMTLIEADVSGVLKVNSAESILASGFAPLRARMLIADEHLPLAIGERARELGVAILSPCFEARDCLAIAESSFDRGEVCDPVALSVLYPRVPEAVTLWRARYPEGFTAKK